MSSVHEEGVVDRGVAWCGKSVTLQESGMW